MADSGDDDRGIGWIPWRKSGSNGPKLTVPVMGAGWTVLTYGTATPNRADNPGRR